MNLEFTVKNKTEERYLYQFKNFQKSKLSIEDYLKKCNKKEISKFKNSIKLINFDESSKKQIYSLCAKYSKFRPKFRKKAEEQLKLKTLENTVNKLKSKRLKLGYRLQEISGLRVGEIADLEQQDINVNKETNCLVIHVKKDKLGNERYVKCFKDNYLLNELSKLQPKKNEKMFCSSKYIIEQANKHNFHTHDLRKVFANTFYYNCTENKKLTIRLLKQQLGHSKKSRTYFKYIYRDINFYKSKLDKIQTFSKEDYENYI